MLLKFLGKYRDAGLLFLRIGIGLCFVIHGITKFSGGVDDLAKVGKAMALLGAPGSAGMWGAIAAATEAFGGALLILGLAYRPICILLAFTMMMATAHLYFNAKMRRLSDFPVVSHPLKMAIIFVGLATIGPGRFSIDKD